MRWISYNNVSMHEFQKAGRLFSSTDQPSESRQHDSKAMQASAITDDKTKESARLNSSSTASQICTSQNLSHPGKPQRDPSSKAPLTVRDENRPHHHRSKFDLNRLGGSNSFKQSVFKDTPNNSYVESKEMLKSSILKGKILKHASRNPHNFTKNLQKDEVESVMFDSKAVKMEGFDPIYLESLMKTFLSHNEPKMNIFQTKVTQVNSKIDAGISNISKMIKQLRVLNLERKIQAKENKYKIKIEQNLCESELEEGAVLPNIQQPLEQQDRSKTDAAELSPSASKIQLMGNFQSEEAALSQEYTMFVNRLAHQIQLDMQFTHHASELSRSNSLPTVKALIISHLGNQRSNINESFFDIDPAEMDPLEKKPSSILQASQAEAQRQASKLHSKYQEIQGHFAAKLSHAFSPSILSLLFEELSSKEGEKRKESVTVGELLSYLNMRTSSSFRNRYFVKMMKRLNLKPNGCLTALALQIFTTHSPTV